MGAKFNLSNANEPLNDRLLNILAKTADYSLTGQNKYNQAPILQGRRKWQDYWLDALIDKSGIGPALGRDKALTLCRAMKSQMTTSLAGGNRFLALISSQYFSQYH